MYYIIQGMEIISRLNIVIKCFCCIYISIVFSFLMVADGWQEEVRYINLNYSSFARRRGISWSGVKVSY